MSEIADIPTMTKKKVEEKILALTTRIAKLRATISRRNSESTKRILLDEEKRLTTTIAIWPAYVESRLVHEHDEFFLNSMRTVRQMVMRHYYEKLKKREHKF